MIIENSFCLDGAFEMLKTQKIILDRFSQAHFVIEIDLTAQTIRGKPESDLICLWFRPAGEHVPTGVRRQQEIKT